MNNQKRRTRFSRVGQVTEEQTASLLGEGILSLLSGLKPFKSEAERRQTWDNNKDRLMYLTIDNNSNLIERQPYTRPAAWWDYEAPEPRKVIKNGEFWNHVKGFHFGKMSTIQLKDSCNADAPRPEYETEKEYLIRLDLVTDFDRQQEGELTL